jgi:tetratricopeptide (TPR) repeat protein
MSNSEILKLISDYSSVLPDSKGENFGKTNVIEKFGEFDDERILQFVLTILVDESEYDLARVDIAKILEYRAAKNEKEKQEIAKSLILVLKNTEDDYLVRQYAAMAISPYSDVEGIFELATQIILNPDEDINVRYNVLDVFERDGPTEKTLKIFRELLKDEEFQKTASRILKEWNQEI